MSAPLIWFRINNGNWNNDPGANPATRTGGYDMSGITAPYYPAGYMNAGFLGAGPLTYNFGAAPFAQAIPAGGVAWGAGTTLDPAANSTGFSTLSNGNLSLNVGGEVTGAGCRATTSSASQAGLRYLEASMTNSAQNWFVGVVSAAYPIPTAVETDFPSEWAGVNDHGHVDINAVDHNGLSGSVFPALSPGDVICVATSVIPPAPVISVNTLLRVGVAGRAMILSTRLVTTGWEGIPADVVYTVTGGPSEGQVLIDTPEPSSIWLPTTTFTQADINNGYLAYQNTGTAVGTDAFTFSAVDSGSLPVTGTLNVLVMEGGDLALLSNTGVSDIFHVPPDDAQAPISAAPYLFSVPGGIKQ